MTKQPAVVRLQSILGSFGRSDRGNIAVLFAIAVVPVISFVGAAVDYTRANTARTSMQSAMEDGVLDAGQGFAGRHHQHLADHAEGRGLFQSPLYQPRCQVGHGERDLYGRCRQRLKDRDQRRRQDRHQLHETGRHPGHQLQHQCHFGLGNVRMRVAMALDVTGSMKDDGKMGAMQTAAKSLIDQLSPLAKNPGDIYISVVPFAKDVNLGTSYRNETWIDWSVWDTPIYSQSTTNGVFELWIPAGFILVFFYLIRSERNHPSKMKASILGFSIALYQLILQYIG